MFDLLGRMGPWYWMGWRVVRTYFAIWHGLRVVGIENLPLRGGAILACNHVSHLDPPSVGCAIPRRLHYVAKEELFHQFFLSWYLPTIGVIPIKRGGGGRMMLDSAAAAIEKGGVIALFPEGTRSRSGLPNRPRTGVMVLAAMTGAPVIPVRISGTYDCMPPGSPLPRPGHIQVAFGTPIRWRPGELDAGDREQLTVAAEMVMKAVQSLPGWVPKRAKARREGGMENELQAEE